MERENFYIILDLSTSPPENNPAKIEKAIKKKQAEWSRLRNHPSKGINAQKYIGLIPEIRKIMTDPALREKEARMALEIINGKLARKYSGIDRHLEILMSKGFIKEDEITKLAQHHKVTVNEIRSRIQFKEREKFTQLDKQIQNRMSKGYITEAELTSLAKIHDMDKGAVRKRVSGPIKKKETKGRLGKVKTLDPSIKKVIEDNLKIVGKTSLYDFLDMEIGADLSELQKRAKEKETEVLKARKKDAIATSSGVLVGHCISLFKNERNRASYDATRARSHLSELDSDIEVAGIEGTIRLDNFDFLVQRAVEFGMDPDEAAKYIKNYCKKKKWRIEKPGKKKRSGKQIVFRLAAFAILLAAGFYQGFILYDNFKRKGEYQRIVSKAESQGELEDKIRILRQYLNEHETHKYTPLIMEKYREYKVRKQGLELDSTMIAADNSIRRDKLDEAMGLYMGYLEKYPKTPRIKELKKKMSDLEKMIERKDFEALQDVSHLSSAERLYAYSRYLEKHPSGEGRDAIVKLLGDLGDAYYVTLSDELDQCEEQKQYAKCVQLIDAFVDAFPEDERSEKLKIIRERNTQKLNEEMVLRQLARQAAEKGRDHAAAIKIYENYLKINPGSPIEDRVREEIEKLDKARMQFEFRAELRRRRALLESTGGRFVSERDNVVVDNDTGLMWAMWDSTHSTADCLDFEAAREYVENLHIGGYDDWRIPTPEELAGIYKSEPFFPFDDAEWYWSSLSYKSYSDGWIFMIEVVDTEKETIYRKQQVDSRKCGAVRAIRP